jgi:hypothetical protein
MDIFYNNQPFNATLVFKQGRTIDMSFNVYKWDPSLLIWALYDLTGMQIDIWFRRLDGLIVKHFSSTGGTPEITIATSSYNISESGFLNEDFLEYDVRVINGATNFDLMQGYGVVQKSITGLVPPVPIIYTGPNFQLVNIGGSLVVQYSTDGITWATVITLYTP